MLLLACEWRPQRARLRFPTDKWIQEREKEEGKGEERYKQREDVQMIQIVNDCFKLVLKRNLQCSLKVFEHCEKYVGHT